MQYLLPDKAYNILKWVGLVALPRSRYFCRYRRYRRQLGADYYRSDCDHRRGYARRRTPRCVSCHCEGFE